MHHPAAPDKSFPTVGSSVVSSTRRRWWTAVAAVLALAGVVTAIVLLGRSGAPPRVNAPIANIARYVDAPGFNKLPFDRQSLYMKVLDDRREELKTAFRNKTLAEGEYRASMEYAWFGRQLPRMEKYAELHDTALRTEYVEKLARKAVADKKAAAAKPAETAKSADAEELPKRMESTEKTFPLTWPAEVQTQWTEYRKALKKAERKVEREMLIETTRRAATQPSGALPPAIKPSGKKKSVK
jgi:hypothetical protein